jgi:NTP pyrophosphatase (non-canonical NTP hydrolase)
MRDSDAEASKPLPDDAEGIREHVRLQVLNELATEVHELAVAKDWWMMPRHPLELLCLVHSEVSEVCEAMRRHNPPSEHLPGFSAAEEELADVLIRCLDMAKAHRWRIGEAVLAKMRYNATRPARHGGKAF